MSAEFQLNPSTSVLVVIVNYRTAPLTIDCLRSLEPEVLSRAGTQVVVVENDSPDDSAEKIEAAIETNGWSEWASLVPSGYNGGYAYGNNVAIRPALAAENPPSYFLLLNPDTQVRAGAISALVEFLEQHSEVGIAGSSFENQDGSLWPIAFRFPSVLSEVEAGLRLGVVTKLLGNWAVPRTMEQTETTVDWLPGASMMIRREVFESVGLMDENYFLYYEETDFCLQAKRAGWSCWYVPQSRVMHIAGQSTGVTVRDSRPKRLPKYWFDSRRRYFVKNHGWFYAVVADTFWALCYTTWRMRRVIQGKPDNDPPQLLGDFIRNSVLFNRQASSQPNS